MKDLVEIYFQENEFKLLHQLRETAELNDRTEALEDASGISDVDLLHRMLDLGIDGDTVPVFQLIPMVAVGWSNGEMCPKQRAKILETAERQGVSGESPAGKVLAGWLSKRIPSRLIDTWIEFSQRLCEENPEINARVLHDEVLTLSQEVAEAAGGIFGFCTVDASEKAMLERLETAFA